MRLYKILNHYINIIKNSYVVIVIKNKWQNFKAVYLTFKELIILVKQAIFTDKFNLVQYKAFIRTFGLKTGVNIKIDDYPEDVQEEIARVVELEDQTINDYIQCQNQIQMKEILIKPYLYNNFFLFDIFVFLLKYNYKKLNILKNFNTLTKLNYVNTFVRKGVYSKIVSKTSNDNYFSNYFLIGWSSIWKSLRLWFLPLLLVLIIIYFGLIVKLLPFNKVIFLWVSLFMVFYWLMSGFVFFFKKYQFGKYTSAVQRFWKRSYIIFWLLESCLLLVFVYLTFNASQESFRMFDQVQINQTHLFSWRLFFLKIFPVVVLINLSYNLLLMLKWNIFAKQSLWLALITVILTYLIWLEFYQFFHIINFYGNLFWVYDIDERLWNLEVDVRRTRIVNHYVMWLLILKFWHLIFVYIFWIFLVLRSWETQRLRYPLLSANLQNLLIVYFMSWLYMYPWFKLVCRKFLDIPYFWFYVSNRNIYVRGFFNDLKIMGYGLLNSIESSNFFNQYNYFSFYYWHASTDSLGFTSYRKYYIKDVIISIFNEVYKLGNFNSLKFYWIYKF